MPEVTLLEQLKGEQIFNAEGVKDSDKTEATPVNILEWPCPEGHMAVAESITIQCSHPQGFYQCLFEIAKDGQRIENIAFSTYPSPTDSPFRYGYWFSEGQKIQLRFIRPILVAGLVFNLQLYGKIKGHYYLKP